jgi:hypothetical protein
VSATIAAGLLTAATLAFASPAQALPNCTSLVNRSDLLLQHVLLRLTAGCLFNTHGDPDAAAPYVAQAGSTE